jgi:histidinol-phosphatase
MADSGTREAPGVLLHAAAEVARVAGAVALSHYRSAALRVEAKGDGSPVTVADRGAETAARAWIEQRFPQDGILGEEFGLARGDARRRWVLDPIDGTKTFVRGVPLWGTLVAVVEGEAVLAGAAFFPAVDELVAAAPGEGCWWNDARCRVSDVATLGEALILTTDPRFAARPERRPAWQALEERAGLSRSWADCYGYLLVATGRAEVMTDAIVGDWDTAALQPIVEEAGGVFTDWRGRPTAFGGSAIATNAALAAEVRAALGATADAAPGAGA